MITKLFEVRDSGTFIPVMAIKFANNEDQERYLLGRAGYGKVAGTQALYVVLIKLGDRLHATHSEHDWPSSTRTMREAHKHIESNFDHLRSGQVVDVEFILGIRATPKTSERFDV